MIQLLYTVSFFDMTLILTLLFETPLRKLVIMALDKVKQGRGPIMVKTVAGTVFVLLLSSVYSIVNIQNSSIDPVAINPTDQVLMATHMLEASLMGIFFNWLSKFITLVFLPWLLVLVCVSQLRIFCTRAKWILRLCRYVKVQEIIHFTSCYSF